MGNCVSNKDKHIDQPRYISPYERLNKIESVYLRDILPNHEDYKLAQTILNQRTINLYGDIMRNSPNMGF
mgnify:CR=1 FL=1